MIRLLQTTIGALATALEVANSDLDKAAKLVEHNAGPWLNGPTRDGLWLIVNDRRGHTPVLVQVVGANMYSITEGSKYSEDYTGSVRSFTNMYLSTRWLGL